MLFILRWCVLLFICSISQAGVTAESTRVIFNEKNNEQSLQLLNENNYPVLVQAWIDDGKLDNTPEKSVSQFVVLPPVFRIEAGMQSSLKFIYSGDPLPKDRESAFWLNIYEISPQNDTSVLNFNMRTQLKFFYRPKNLKSDPEKNHELIEFSIIDSVEKNTLRVKNPTPYFVTLSAVQISQGERAEMLKLQKMLEPFSDEVIDAGQDFINSNSKDEIYIKYQIIDDYGNPVDHIKTLK